MDFGILKTIGGVLALCVALAIVLPWVWSVVKKFWPSASTSTTTGSVIQQVASKAAIALVWSAVQTIVQAAYAQGDTATATAALALLPQVHTWDDGKTDVATAAAAWNVTTVQENPTAAALASLQSQVAELSAKVGG
jgi:predicted Zn-dependent protease